MAYGRRRRTVKRGNNRRRRGTSLYGASRFTRYANMAYTAYRGVRMLKGLVNVEKKLYTKSIVSTPTIAGTVQVLTDMAAGDDVNNRNGNSILAKYILYSGTATMPESEYTQTVRFIILQDLKNEGSLPSPSDILETVNVNSPMNADAVDRFWIIADKKFTLNSGGGESKPINIFRRLNFHIKYDGVLAADYDTNTLLLLTVSTGTSAPPTITGYSRLAFYDN